MKNMCQYLSRLCQLRGKQNKLCLVEFRPHVLRLCYKGAADGCDLKCMIEFQFITDQTASYTPGIPLAFKCLMIRVGCSGYYYPQWKNKFYPAGMKPRDWLAYYSSVFNTVELNGTFYKMPKPTDLIR